MGCGYKSQSARLATELECSPTDREQLKFCIAIGKGNLTASPFLCSFAGQAWHKYVLRVRQAFLPKWSGHQNGDTLRSYKI
jgi:hypothetical protein